ncbi:MAG TPA: hypothetical protein VM347_32395 [Nonomuraea sp.]|nr:hypothetical protein [Nonomuraea sp.]
MDNRLQVREFLTSRRAKITPAQVGTPVAGRRRVPGLRRSEVAALAGMSVEYYAKLERGSLAGVSSGVLDAIPDWDLAADMSVANLRTSAGKDPHDKGLHDLVGELSTRSDDFRRRWGAHNVRTHGTGIKHFHHHIVGDLTLAYESMDLRAEPDLSMTLYAAEPGSPSEDALRLLASWAATHEHSERT